MRSARPVPSTPFRRNSSDAASTIRCRVWALSSFDFLMSFEPFGRAAATKRAHYRCYMKSNVQPLRRRKALALNRRRIPRFGGPDTIGGEESDLGGLIIG